MHPAAFWCGKTLGPSDLQSSSCLSMSSEEEAGGDTGKRRRKRKDGKNLASIGGEDGETVPPPPPIESPSPIESASPIESKPDPEPEVAAPVEMQVMDVRDILSGGTAATTTASPPSDTLQQNDARDEDDEEEDDDDEYEETDEYEYYFTDEDNNEIIVDENFGTSLTTATSPSAMNALLADARKMRETQSPSASDEEGGAFEARALAIKVLSTIVTADFFVVVALLLWFLVGVFFAKVLGDDSVYLYFAGLFEPVVQPALGILILGAAASAVFKDKEVEDE